MVGEVAVERAGDHARHRPSPQTATTSTSSTMRSPLPTAMTPRAPVAGRRRSPRRRGREWHRARGRSYIEEVGDPRASAQNNIVMEFLGDYVYAAATNEYAVAVWNDVRDGDVCGPVQSWRADMQADPSTFPEGRPAIQQSVRRPSGTRTSSLGRERIRRRKRPSDQASGQGAGQSRPFST